MMGWMPLEVVDDALPIRRQAGHAELQQQEVGALEAEVRRVVDAEAYQVLPVHLEAQRHLKALRMREPAKHVEVVDDALVVEARAPAVGRADDVVDARLAGGVEHGLRLGEIVRPVIDVEQDMAMEVEHGEMRSSFRLTSASGSCGAASCLPASWP